MRRTRRGALAPWSCKGRGARVALWVACGVALLSSRAGAEGPAPVELHWSAPAGCPTEAEVRAAVERLAGRPLGASVGEQRPATMPLRVRIEAAPEGSAWTAQIEVEHPGSVAPLERRIDGQACAQVAEAAVVAAALAIGPPPPAPADPHEVPEAPTAPDPPRLLTALRASGGVDLASLPAPAPGIEIGAALLFGDNRVEIRGSAWLSQRITAAIKPTAGVEISLFVAGARYCRTLLQSTLELAGCAGADAGAFHGRGFGVTRPVSGGGPYLAPGVGVLGLWHFSSSWSLALGLDGLVLASREPFTLVPLGTIYTPPWLTGRLLFGLEGRL